MLKVSHGVSNQLRIQTAYSLTGKLFSMRRVNSSSGESSSWTTYAYKADVDALRSQIGTITSYDNASHNSTECPLTFTLKNYRNYLLVFTRYGGSPATPDASSGVVYIVCTANSKISLEKIYEGSNAETYITSRIDITTDALNLIISKKDSASNAYFILSLTAL